MSEATEKKPWLTRNVKVLSAVSLAQDAASEMLYPLLPILLTTTLGAPAAVVGIVEGIAEGVAALIKYISGRTSDRVGRKPAVATGYGLAAVGKIIIAAATVWPGVLAGRVVDRVGRESAGTSRRPARDGVATTSMGKGLRLPSRRRHLGRRDRATDRSGCTRGRVGKHPGRSGSL